MREAFDRHGRPLSDEARLTSLGKTLRRLSFDEIPQLWNVLRGEMSLVGPRPLLMEYLDLYSPEQRRRHTVRPGITGWAQVNGRNALGWEDRFRLDVWYVDHASLRLDLRILALTVVKTLRKEGISSPERRRCRRSPARVERHRPVHGNAAFGGETCSCLYCLGMKRYATGVAASDISVWCRRPCEGRSRRRRSSDRPTVGRHL